MRIGIIGYGYWGPNLARNFAELPDVELAAVSDARPERLALAGARYPGVQTFTDARALITQADVDAVAIATPVSTHFPLAMLALQADKHVFVEKPVTASTDDAEQLIAEAERRQRVLMVDHTFIYTGAVRKIKEIITGEDFGDILYYDSVRVNLGLFQHDVNVIWDLAVHDLSIMDYLLPEQPCAVSATGMSHVAGEPANIAYLTLFYPGNMIAHLHVNWLAPVKVRQTLIGGSQKMIVYDDMEPSEKVKVYDKGITVQNDNENVYKLLVEYRTGDMWAPRCPSTEALRCEALEFVDCVTHGRQPVSDGAMGARIVRILEAANHSMDAHGQPIELGKVLAS